LVLLIITFFLPFFSVSCSSSDAGVNFSGLELSTGKSIGNYRQSGNLFGFILIIPPVGLLVLAFLIHKIKKVKIYNIYKTIFFIAPLFDIFAVFIVRYAFYIILKNRLAEIPIYINTKYGFLLYIIFNAGVFIFAVRNYFIKRES